MPGAVSVYGGEVSTLTVNTAAAINGSCATLKSLQDQKFWNFGTAPSQI